MYIIIQTHLCVINYFQQCYSMILLKLFLFKTHWMSFHMKHWICFLWISIHYSDIIMGTMAFRITSLTIVYSTVYSGTDQRKHQSSASLAFVRGIHWGPVNSPHKWPVTQNFFPFDVVIMAPDEPSLLRIICSRLCSWWSFCVWYHGLTTSILYAASFWSLKQMASEFDIKEN